MKKITFGVVLVLLLAAVWYAVERRSAEVPAAGVDPIATHRSPAGVGRDVPPPEARTGGRHGGVQQEGAVPADPIAKIEIGADPYRPQTPEEADWLNRHGFPSMEEEKRANLRIPSFEAIDLRDGANVRELIDLARLGYDPAQRDQAVESLQEAAALGSMYALEALARIHLVEPRDFVLSEAYYRAAAIRGNWGVEIRLKPRLSREEDVLASLTAHRIIEHANALRARRGLGPLIYEARPGLAHYLDAMAQSTN